MRNRKNDLSVMMRRISSARYVLALPSFFSYETCHNNLHVCSQSSVVRNTVNVLTEDDEEMALMNLTVLKDKPSLYQ